MDLTDHYTRPWFQYVTPQLQDLIRTGLTLHQHHTNTQTELPDYSFLIFPISKAYEGFLKKYLHDLDLITKEDVESRRFRIGRAINPDVRMHQRDENWLFDDLAHSCGQETARQVWETWLKCRNRVFHYFPKEASMLSLAEATFHIELLLNTMELAVQCQPDLGVY